MHLNKKTLEYTERETCGSFLLIMHLFPKQINRRITQTNITHRTASVERPIPDEERRGGRESLFVPSATVCNIHIAEIHNSPKKIHPRPSPPLSTTVGNMEPGNPGSYEQLLYVVVSNTSSERRLPGSQHLTRLTTFIRMGQNCASAQLAGVDEKTHTESC